MLYLDLASGPYLPLQRPYLENIIREQHRIFSQRSSQVPIFPLQRRLGCLKTWREFRSHRRGGVSTVSPEKRCARARIKGDIGVRCGCGRPFFLRTRRAREGVKI